MNLDFLGKYWLILPILAILTGTCLYVTQPVEDEVPLSHDDELMNWTSYSGSFSNSLMGYFNGEILERNETIKRWCNMSGIFDGRCFILNQMRGCHFKVAGGCYSGGTPYGSFTSPTHFEGNLSGVAVSWNVIGKYDEYGAGVEEKKPLEWWVILLILGLGVVAAFILHFERRRRIVRVDDAELEERLRVHLGKPRNEGGWSMQLHRVWKTRSFEDSGILKKRVHFTLERPYGQHCLCEYDMLAGKFENFHFGARPSDVDIFMGAEVKLVEEKERIRKLRRKGKED